MQNQNKYCNRTSKKCKRWTWY